MIGHGIRYVHRPPHAHGDVDPAQPLWPTRFVFERVRGLKKTPMLLYIDDGEVTFIG
jgi:hypothetical protein